MAVPPRKFAALDVGLALVDQIKHQIPRLDRCCLRGVGGSSSAVFTAVRCGFLAVSASPLVYCLVAEQARRTSEGVQA